MTTDPVERYLAAKRLAEKAQREQDRAAGVLDGLLTRLSKEFGCDSIELAKKLHIKLQAELKKAELALQKALAAFEEKWSDRLEE